MSFFSSDTLLFRFTGAVLDIVVLSLLWLVCCLPIVTIGPASAALYYSCVKCLRYKEPAPYLSFLSAFRENLKTGVGATVAFLLLAVPLYGVYAWLTGMANSGGTAWLVIWIAYLVCLLLPLAVVSCAFPLLSRFSCTVGGLLKSSIQITFRHLPRLLAAAALNAALIYLTWKWLFFCVMLLTPALGALAVSYLIEPVLRKYTPASGDETGENGEAPWYLR